MDVRNGRLRALEVPAPLVRPRHVLIANAASIISAGTERATLELARKSLLGKALERPDQVRKVLENLRKEGVFQTLDKVHARLEEPLALGYASAGTVIACGEGVQRFRPGQRVASNGPHAGVVCVPVHLCAAVPEGVETEHAAFAVIGAIALQGVRLANLALGELGFVIGLGIVGQLTVALLKAAGVRVWATDLSAERCALAIRMGADRAEPRLAAEEVATGSAGFGADGVLVTAADESGAAIALAADAVRAKGRIVVVGAVGLDVPRRPMYFKEAELVVSRSYGPGRYDASYEERGQEYPLAHVRWTEERNIQGVLDLMASRTLDVGPLISHRFPVERAEDAFNLVSEGKEPFLGVVLQYSEPVPGPRIVSLRGTPLGGEIGIGLVGAGRFAREVLLPAIGGVRNLRLEIIASQGGVTAVEAGSKAGFAQATTDEEQVFAHPRVDCVFIATRHDLHARQVISALKRGKHVFVEKPLALALEEVEEIENALRSAQGQLLMVGFNRRFAPATSEVRAFFEGVEESLSVSIRMNVGRLPPDHWTQDEGVGGGRIVGEACHAIDLATFLTGSLPVRVYAESAPGADDQAFLTLRHQNGSVSSIAYISSGDQALGKERVEVFGGGRVGVIDDFQEVFVSKAGRGRRKKRWRRDKGHRSEIAAFAQAVRSGAPPPIPWEEIRAVTLASLLAVRSLREGIPFDIP